MNRPFWVSTAALTMVLCAATVMRAQWETPNRGFHNATSFRLEGRHLTVACESCHVRGVYKGTPNTCVGCHWIRRQDDRYALRLGAQCEQCHRPTSWTEVRWDHGAATGMPLNAAHKTLSCETCHRGGEFTSTNSSCVSCHQRDYEATRTPNHAAAGFPTTCEQCHRPAEVTWRGAGVNHNQFFPLQGTHATVACASCHRNNQYKGTPRDCVGCHRADYDRTQTPNHVAAGFPTTCEQCHRPAEVTWRGAGFNHNQFFALQGTHATVACASCHRNNQYKGTPRDCVGCHRVDYDRTQTPNHVAAGFPTTCESCHRSTDPGWRGAAFNHNQFFALQGVHAQQACQNCHANGQYKGTPRDCVGCHRAVYDRTRNPNHTASGFPTNCESCHRPTDAAWTQGTFNHTRFPLTGPHRRDCSACHLNASNYREFSCTVCHQRGDTDAEHRGRSGYRYNSAACYACHPTGRGD